MSEVMAAQMGMALVDSWSQYQTARIQAGLQSKIQDYRNTMSRLSAARATNAVTINSVRVRDASVQADQIIQRTALQDQARAEVDAAAAGVAGNSVEAVMKDLRASAGRASYAQRRQAHQQQAELLEQKTSIAIAAVTNQDIQVVPKPSVGSLLLGAGTSLLEIYDSHQPAGSRTLE